MKLPLEAIAFYSDSFVARKINVEQKVAENWHRPRTGPHTVGQFWLRRLERVFRCYIVCETMEDYKEGCLMVWANYMSPCNSIVGLYFKGTCDVISVTMATHKVHKSVL